MRFYLKELMQLENFQGAAVLAGQAGIDNQIGTVNILDSKNSLKHVKEDSLVFYTADFDLEEEGEILALLEELSKRHVAAIGAKFHTAERILSEEVRAKSDELNLPVIALPDDFYYIDVVDKIQSYIYCYSVKKFIDMADIHVEFNKYTSKHGFMGVMELLYRLTGLRITMISGEKRSEYPHTFKLERFDYISTWQESKAIALKNSKYMFGREIRMFGAQGNDALTEGVGIEVNYKDKRSYIWLWKDSRNFSESDFAILGIAAYWYDLINRKTYEIQAELQRNRTDFMNRLLMADDNNREELFKEAKSLEWELPESASVLLIKSPEGGLKELVSQLNGYLHAKYEAVAMVAKHGTDVVVLLPPIFGNPEEIGSSIMDYATKKFPDKRFFIGVGRETNLESFPLSYDEAKHAAKIGHATEQDLVYFESLNLYRLLYYPHKTEEMMKFFDDYYKPLKDFDAKHTSELIRTAQYYLDSGCNYSLTAKKLFLHHNTVRYRISLVEKLCNIDLKTQDGILSLGTALMLAPLMPEGLAIYDDL
jgi:purine catabolism regulator